jgi:hypothetical protein
MTLHLALSKLSAIDDPRDPIHAEAVAMAHVWFVHTTENLSIGEYLLTWAVLEPLDCLPLKNNKFKFKYIESFFLD